MSSFDFYHISQLPPGAPPPKKKKKSQLTSAPRQKEEGGIEGEVAEEERKPERAKGGRGGMRGLRPNWREVD